jgi:ATP-dependent exoDNAse (exonuclease V) beta subunit
MKDELLLKLKCFDDPEFKFDPLKHKYTYHGEVFQSVTQFIGEFHLPFDTEKWSKIKADQAGVDQEEIKKEWKRLNEYSNEIGTDMHNYIELYYKNEYQKLPTNLDLIHRINKFNIIYAKHLHKLEPLAFEVRVFSKKWKKAGMIDSLFIHNGKIFILDWKSNKEFRTDSHIKGKYHKLLKPFDDYYANHLNEYSIQLSMYASILEEWGFEVGGAYLVHIGPDDEEAKLYKVIDMRDIIKNYFSDSKN